MYTSYQNCIIPDKKKEICSKDPFMKKAYDRIHRHMKIIQLNAECDVNQYRITSCCGVFCSSKFAVFIIKRRMRLISRFQFLAKVSCDNTFRK